MPEPASPPLRLARVPRLAARREAAEWAQHVFLRLRWGMTVSDIARFDNCSERTVRRVVARTLAQRERDGTAGYAQLQIARLNDALMVASHRMVAGDLKALECVLKIMESQDRYHGFGGSGGPAPVPVPLRRVAPIKRLKRLTQRAELAALPAPEASAEITYADKNQAATS